MNSIDIILFIISVTILLTIVELVRRKHLREKYSLIWLFVALVLVVLSLSRGFVEKIALSLNVYYPPSLLFLGGIFFLLMLSVALSVIVSHQTTRIIGLVQETAILEERLRKLESNKDTKDKPVDSK